MSYSLCMLLYPALLDFCSLIDCSGAIVDFLLNYTADLDLTLHMDGRNNGGEGGPVDRGDNPNPGDPRNPNPNDNIKPISDPDGKKEDKFVTEDPSKYAGPVSDSYREEDKDHVIVDNENGFLNSYNTESNNLPETAKKLDRGEPVEDNKLNA